MIPHILQTTEIELTGPKSGEDAPTRVLTIDEPRRIGTLHPEYPKDLEFRAKWRKNVKDKEEHTEHIIEKFQWTHNEARGIIIRDKGWIQVAFVPQNPTSYLISRTHRRFRCVFLS